jgi:hypothetical protein
MAAAVLQAAMLRKAIESAACRQLDGDRHLLAKWGKGKLATLQNLDILDGSALLDGLQAEWYIASKVAKTALEAAEGRWQDALLVVGHNEVLPLAELESAFMEQVAPAMSAVGTRVKHWQYWRSVVTWGIAHKCLADLLPMRIGTLQALTWDLMNLHCAAGHIADVWSAVQARHHEYGLLPPLVKKGIFGRWKKGVASLVGSPRRLSYPIQKEHIHAMLLLDVESAVDLRNLMLSAVATVCCLRPVEVRLLRACDWVPEFDKGRGLSAYHGTAATRIPQRKQDQARKGHWPRVGRSKDPRKDIVYQMYRYMSANGLRVSGSCHQKVNPGARCAACPPLFPASQQEWRKNSGGVFQQRSVLTSKAMSAAGVTAAIRRALYLVGADGQCFTAKAARKGGISAAMEAGVPECELWMQSGHSQSRAARVYVELASPTLLFDTFGAFGL